MSTIRFRTDDLVRVARIPIGYLGCNEPAQLEPLIDLELRVLGVDGDTYVLALDKPRWIGVSLQKAIPVHHSWLEPIGTTVVVE